MGSEMCIRDRYYQQIIAIEPDNVDAYISLATQYSWKGEMDKAIVTFEKAESIAPDNVAVLELSLIHI